MRKITSMLERIHSALFSRTGKPFFYKLLASFLVMLLLPSAILLFNYYYAHNLLTEENQSHQDDLLIQTQISVDRKLQNLQLFTLNLGNDSSVNKFLTDTSFTKDTIGLEVLNISRHLGTVGAGNRNLCEIYLYAASYDIAVGTNSTGYLHSERVIALESPELYPLLEEALVRPRQFSKYELLRDGDSVELLLLHSVPLWSSGRATGGTICLLLDKKEVFQDIMQMKELQKGLVCLLDEEGQMIISMGNTALLPAWQQSDPVPEAQLNIDGADYTISCVGSEINHWQYLSIQPVHTLVMRLEFLRTLWFGIFMLLILLGAGIAWALSRHNYRPVEELLTTLQRHSAVMRKRADSGENEFHIIERSVQEMSDSVNILNTVLKDEIPRIQDRMLVQLLYDGVSDYDAFATSLADMGILFPYQYFQVAVIRICDDQEEFTESAIAAVLIKEQLQKLIPSHMICGITSTKSNTVAAILNSNSEALDEESTAVMHRLIEAQTNDCNRMITVCLSRIVKGIDQVGHAYSLVVQVNSMMPNEVFRLSMHPAAQIKHRVDKTAAHLCNFISVGNEEKAVALLKQQYASDIAGQILEVHSLLGYYAGLISIVCASYAEEVAAAMPEKEDPLALLFAATSAEEMEALAEEVVVRLCESVKSKQQSHAAQLCNQILEFIYQEYANEDLTLSFVANKFCMTPSYLSTFFKENVGDTFLNYLTRLRIEHAKELIRSTNLPVGEIAGKVGYASGNSFTRIFKKVEGITPSQYRENP